MFTLLDDCMTNYWYKVVLSCAAIYLYPYPSQNAHMPGQTIWLKMIYPATLNTLRPRQNGYHFPEWIFLSEIVRISIQMSLRFVPKGPINNISALVQIMAWRRPGDKPLTEPMMVSLLTHICVTRQVKQAFNKFSPSSSSIQWYHFWPQNFDEYLLANINRVLTFRHQDW